MTSKISCIKFIKEDLRQRAWLIAILSTITFLFQPMMLVIGINTRKKWLSDLSTGFTDKEFKQWLLNFMGFQNNALIFCVILFAILCGVSGFCYLHSKEKLNLIHSLPIRREKLFLIQFVSGFLIFLIPFTLNFLISLLNISFQGLLSLKLLKISFSAFGIHVLFFLCLYALAIFAMIVTGKLLTGLVITFSLFTYGTILIALFRLLANRFFPTYFMEVNPYHFASLYVTTNGKDGFSSPLFAYLSALNQMSEHRIPYGLLLFALFITIIFVLLGILLYRLRPTEAAGKSIAFSKAESILKILLSVPLGIFSAYYLNSLSGQDSNDIIFFMLSILCTFIFAIVIEFIYTLNFRHLFAKKGALLISVLLTFGTVAIYHFDLFKYDNYIPKRNEIESMSVYLDEFSTRFRCPFFSETQSAKDFLDSSETANFDFIYRLAQKGAESFAATDENAQSVYIKYHLKNGRSIYRNYLINEADTTICAKQLLNDHFYKEKLFQTDFYNNTDFHFVEITDIYQNTMKLSISEEQIKTLIDIYQKELLNASYLDFTSVCPSGMICFSTKDALETYARPLLSDFTDTYNYLKELGYTFPTTIDADKIDYIQVQNHDTGKNMLLNSPEEFSEILPELTSDPYHFYKKPIEFNITFKNSVSNYGIAFYLNSDQIPECIKTLTDE